MGLLYGVQREVSGKLISRRDVSRLHRQNLDIHCVGIVRLARGDMSRLKSMQSFDPRSKQLEPVVVLCCYWTRRDHL